MRYPAVWAGDGGNGGIDLPLLLQVLEVEGRLLSIVLPEYARSDSCSLSAIMDMLLQDPIGLLPR